jgi:lipopolysaccharide/colanic/teichoic acid biosynthesis glycosyltransferase
MTQSTLQVLSPAAPPISAWCGSAGKRLFDVILAAVLLIVASPVMAIAAAAVKLFSPGPTLFRQRRMGLNGKEFELLKFRSMQNGAHRNGPGVTADGDDRITPVGRILRKTKMDELPQLWNVLRGDMSLIGPRPDLPQYFAAADADCRRVLLLQPGITGPASLQYHNEEEVLSQIPASQLEAFYISSWMPMKIRLELEYAEQASFPGDLRLIVATVRRLVMPRSARKANCVHGPQ